LPISIRFGTNHSWEKGIKGQVLFKGEIITKIGCGHLKIVSKTIGTEKL
jgi:hypothetical protein